MIYLIIEAWTVTPHLETGLEIALNLSRDGNEVWYCNIANNLLHPEGKAYRIPTGLGSLLGYQKPEIEGIRRAKSLARSNGWKLKFVFPKPPRQRFPDVPKEYLQSNKDLKNFTIYNHRAGVAIASSIISAYGVEEDKPFLYEDEINTYLRDYIVSAFITARLINRISPDCLVLFNGRFPSVAAIANTAKDYCVRVLYHERAGCRQKYTLRPFTPHNRLAIQAEIVSTWDGPNSLTMKSRIANSFFSSQRSGEDIAWKSFTKHHALGSAAKIVQYARSASISGCVVSFFTTTSDEMESLIDNHWENSLFLNQKEALVQLIVQSLDAGHSVIIRNHPHMAIKKSPDRFVWDKLSFAQDLSHHPRVQIIESHETVSSYELLDLSDIIACYGSSVGVEALSLGKPVVQLGSGVSYYDMLGSDLFIPSTLDELRYWLTSGFRSQVITTRTSELYGYWLLEHGLRYQFYHPTDLFSGTFLGVNLHDQPPTRRHKTVDYFCKRLRLNQLPAIYRHI